MKKIISIISISCSCLFLKAQPFATWTDTELKLSNGIVERTIMVPSKNGSFTTTSYKPVKGIFNYFQKSNTDFQFEINSKIYSGKSNWIFKNIAQHSDAKNGDGAAITIISEDEKVEVTVQFLLYKGSPVIRKNLVIKNLTNELVSLESVDVEKFETTDYYAPTFSWVCHDYGRRRSLGSYDGTMQDALITIHNTYWKQGIVIGNEASGILKHTAVFWQEPTIISGLTHKNTLYPFRKYIAPNAAFVSPQVFTIVYNNTNDPDEILNTSVADFVRKFLGSRLEELKQKPTFVYNTWSPFAKNINEKLVMELAKSAADAGIKEFVIDDGWSNNYGDWQIDKTKFPNGLKPVFDYIKSLGMKPGLWVSVGSASATSKVYQEHPDWFVLDKNQKPFNLHENNTTMFTACFSTGWYNYIKGVLQKLSLEYGLEYLKLDFTVVSSPYRFNSNETGCYATNHANHKDREESFYVNYERVWQLFDELHAAKPNLFIDCTFETMGGLQLIDYAMLKHAEGNWLSNYDVKDENEDLLVRNMAWWRSPAIPATSLVIGNPQMQDKGWELHIKSLAGALPIMLGDPRKLSAIEIKKYRQYADWLQLMEHRYQIMSYRQDIVGFNEPKLGMWDAFQRINSDTKLGGIVGVFRQGAVEKKRRITVNYLDNNIMYLVKSFDGKVITKLTGKDLQTKGFEVTMDS
ncbi:MAG: alpha-galactosidase, partial [Pedobacter sp.]|nr:alpha-galactosidase [Chitinophagaceae bacterium]